MGLTRRVEVAAAALLVLGCVGLAQAQPASAPAADAAAQAATQTAGAGPPGNEQYGKLLEAQKRYQQMADSGSALPRISGGETMSPGSSYDCARLDALRQRLAAEGFEGADDAAPAAAQPPAAAPAAGQCRYEGALVDAVRSFQASRRLKVDGEVGARTLERLHESPQDLLKTIDQALQRWREKAGELTGSYVLVNIPAFELAVYEGQREVMRMPVVVGQPDWPTPQMSESLEYLVLNPEWRIPDTIADAELKPKRKKDPGYFKREGIEVTEDGKLRQKPGPRNPLGRIKFMMPNDEDIYLHDTPAKRHFESSWRALSHGCIRVAQPLELAEYVMKGDPQWTRERLQSAIDSGATEEVKLPRPMPVHLVYIPAQVDAQGRLEVLPDVYGQFGDREAAPPAGQASDEDGVMPAYP
ncbi:MAG TPA: L,D-transpeptidase family protein [Candidatus Limnocylindrales bacterium]|nr:L,D-transpeptidase family protein [Candidatus Limnocylindrales bacterium]